MWNEKIFLLESHFCQILCGPRKIFYNRKNHFMRDLWPDLYRAVILRQLSVLLQKNTINLWKVLQHRQVKTFTCSTSSTVANPTRTIKLVFTKVPVFDVLSENNFSSATFSLIFAWGRSPKKHVARKTPLAKQLAIDKLVENDLNMANAA